MYFVSCVHSCQNRIHHYRIIPCGDGLLRIEVSIAVKLTEWTAIVNITCFMWSMKFMCKSIWAVYSTTILPLHFFLCIAKIEKVLFGSLKGCGNGGLIELLKLVSLFLCCYVTMEMI